MSQGKVKGKVKVKVSIIQSFSLHFFWSFYPQQHFIVLKHNLWSAILAQMPWQAKNDFIFEFYGSFYPNEHIIS